jgi:hypothetical protein
MGYDSLFRTNNYHIVNGKNDQKGEYQIIPNSNDYQGKVFHVDRHPASFLKYGNRPPIANDRLPSNEKRFDNFDRSSRIHSDTIYHGNYKFEKQLPRVVEKTVFPKKEFMCEYDNVGEQNEFLMRSLKTNCVSFDKQSIRNIGQSFGGYMTQSKNFLTQSSLDESIFHEACQSVRKKSLALASIDNYTPRDLMLYT